MLVTSLGVSLHISNAFSVAFVILSLAFSPSRFIFRLDFQSVLSYGSMGPSLAAVQMTGGGWVC